MLHLESMLLIKLKSVFMPFYNNYKSWTIKSINFGTIFWFDNLLQMERKRIHNLLANPNESKQQILFHPFNFLSPTSSCQPLIYKRQKNSNADTIIIMWQHQFVWE